MMSNMLVFIIYTMYFVYYIYIFFLNMPVYIYCKNHGPFISYIYLYIDIYIHSQTDPKKNYLAPHPKGFCCLSKKSREFLLLFHGLSSFRCVIWCHGSRNGLGRHVPSVKLRVFGGSPFWVDDD